VPLPTPDEPAAAPVPIVRPVVPDGQEWNDRAESYAVSTLVTAGFEHHEVSSLFKAYADEWRPGPDPVHAAMMWVALQEEWGPSFEANRSRAQDALDKLSGPHQEWLAAEMEGGHLSPAFVAALAYTVHVRTHGRGSLL
jgi:hypothetical protein